jgi:hypothetical protein
MAWRRKRLVGKTKDKSATDRPRVVTESKYSVRLNQAAVAEHLDRIAREGDSVARDNVPAGAKLYISWPNSWYRQEEDPIRIEWTWNI